MYKAKMLANLRDHHGKWVNFYCVVRGLEVNQYEKDLSDLIVDGRIERTSIDLGTDKFGRPVTGKLYRLSLDEISRGSDKLSLVQ